MPLKRKWDVTEGDEKGKKREEKGIFKRSNKISRSPAEKRNGEDLRGILKELGQEMREGLKEVKKEIREMAKGQKEALHCGPGDLKKWPKFKMLTDLRETWLARFLGSLISNLMSKAKN